MQKLYAVPAELRALRQWVLWKYVDVGAAKPTKVPYQINGEKADVNNPFSWSSFEECFNVLSLGGYDGIGFVFTSNDPYCVIDLDDTLGDTVAYERQLKIFNEFDSYSEISPSGRGLHVIVKGQVPTGRRRNFVEVYSSQRYITMTGNVYKDSPIYERQQLLDQLYAQMGGPPKVHTYTGNDPQREDDAIIIQRARNAANGERFSALDDGQWAGSYPSQSEADFAYIDMLAFYTQNRAQIERMFRASKLMRNKVNENKGYLIEMINRSFDRLTPPIDFDGFKIALEEKLANKVEAPIKIKDISTASTIPLPIGLVGEIAQFIYNAAPRPVPEVAIAGAIGLMAGICGSAYNVSATGLNQYILCLAGTGVGKDAAASGIDKIISEVMKQVPVATEFVGPSEIASGQALLKHISTKPNCFVSILGEFGIKLKMMSDPRASAAEHSLRRTLLQLYTKSGVGQTLRSSIYADKDKNTNDTLSPALTILAESTPETVYEAVNEQMVLDGLLPRFTIIEYDGDRRLLNKIHAHTLPPPDMISKIAELMAHCKMMMANKRAVIVRTDDNVSRLLDKYDRLTTEKINSKDVNRSIKELWSRADVKIIKLAALLAVGMNMHEPVIDQEMFEWARSIIEANISTLSKKFQTGETGKASNELRQIYDLKRIMKQYVASSFDRYQKLQYISNRMHTEKIILYKFLSQRTGSLASYKDDSGRGRATEYLNKVLKVMIDNGEILEVSKLDMMKKFNSSQKAYVISDMSLFDDVNIE